LANIKHSTCTLKSYGKNEDIFISMSIKTLLIEIRLYGTWVLIFDPYFLHPESSENMLYCMHGVSLK